MNYEQFMLQEEQLDEVTMGGLTNAVVRRGVKRGGSEVKSNTAAQGRATAGDVGKAANEVSSAATNVSDAKDVTKGAKAIGRSAAKKAAKNAPKTAAKVSNALKPVANVAKKVGSKVGTALKGASAPVKAAGKALSGPAGAAAVGTGIADATFRNKENQKKYADYSPKDTFGFGPGKTKNVYKQPKASEGAYAKELGATAKKVTDTLSASGKGRGGRSGAKRRTGK